MLGRYEEDEPYSYYAVDPSEYLSLDYYGDDALRAMEKPVFGQVAESEAPQTESMEVSTDNGEASSNSEPLPNQAALQVQHALVQSVALAGLRIWEHYAEYARNAVGRVAAIDWLGWLSAGSETAQQGGAGRF